VNYWNIIIEKTRKLNNRLYPAYSYFEKGNFFFNKGKKEIAISNYLLAQKTLNNNDSLKAFLFTRIGIAKSRNKEYKEALILLKESMLYFNSKEFNNDEYYSLLLNIISVYFNLNQFDLASFYSNKLVRISKKNKDSTIIGYGLSVKGRIGFRQKNYKLAILNLKKSIPYIIKDENFQILSDVYLEIANSYFKLNNKKESLKYFHKIDSLKEVTKIIQSSQKPAYKYLISHYKKENNSTKQLEYINKYIKVDSVLNKMSKNISKSLTDNYDIPNLLAERKRIENRLKGSLSITKKWIISIATIATLLLLFLIQQIRKRKLYKKRFQQLMNPANLEQQKEKPIARKEQSIPNKIVTQILKSLDKFEKEHYYISSETTLTSLAKTFETNSKYLSQVINQQKGQSFSNYINSLRINYTVRKLKTDARFRKYSINAIANEVGFNTSESFSKAFYKHTGIKPSYFIKELEKK
jgi:AraC-like DNA-binding protein